MDDIFDEAAEIESLTRVFEPFVLTAFKKGIEQGLKQGTGFAVEDIFTDAVKLAIKKKALEHATLAVGTTKDALQDLLTTAIQEGHGVGQLAEGIRDYFGVNSRPRSRLIARTEMTDAINDGTSQTITREGYRQKEWSTVVDGNERPTHHSANGQVVGINEPFIIGGEAAMYPGDDRLSAGERCNCRCAVVGAGLPEDRVRKLGEQFIRIHGSLENRFVVQLLREFDRQRRRILSHLSP